MSFQIPLDQVNCDAMFSINETLVPKNVRSPSYEINHEEVIIVMGYFFFQGGKVIDEQALRRYAEYIKNKRLDRAGKNGILLKMKKTEMRFWFKIEELLSHARDRICNLSTLWSDFLSAELPRYHFTEPPGNRLLITCMEKESQRSITGNRSSQLDNNESCVPLSKLHCSHTNVTRDLESQHDYNYHYNQNKRKKIMRRHSSFLVSTIVFLGILFNISSQFSVNQVQPLPKEYDDRLSIWLSLLSLFCFMVLVCAIAVMILVGGAFSTVQKAMLIFWLTLMHLKSANSITEMLFSLAGGVFMGWYAFSK